jgi:hypothetical protein
MGALLVFNFLELDFLILAGNLIQQWAFLAFQIPIKESKGVGVYDLMGQVSINLMRNLRKKEHQVGKAAVLGFFDAKNIAIIFCLGQKGGIEGPNFLEELIELLRAHLIRRRFFNLSMHHQHGLFNSGLGYITEELAVTIHNRFDSIIVFGNLNRGRPSKGPAKRADFFQIQPIVKNATRLSVKFLDLVNHERDVSHPGLEREVS